MPSGTATWTLQAGLLAATLAGGTATYLARLHAGRFLGLSYKTRRDGRIEVTAGQAGRNRPGIAFLQFATMREGDLQVVEGVRCTSVSRPSSIWLPRSASTSWSER